MPKTKKQKITFKKLPFKFEFKLSERIKKGLIILLAFLSLGIVLFNVKHWFIAALVNWRPVTRYAMFKELEKQGGSQVLEGLITESLIFQEAKRQKIMVTREELETEVGKIEEQVGLQGQSLDDLLAMRGQTRGDLEEQIKMQLVVEKILGQDIEVGQEELEEYFEKQKEFLAEGIEFEEVKGEMERSLRQEKINEKFATWLGELQEKAKIHYFLKF